MASGKVMEMYSKLTNAQFAFVEMEKLNVISLNVEN